MGSTKQPQLQIVTQTLIGSLVLSSALFATPSAPDSGSIQLQNKSEKNIPITTPKVAKQTGIAITASIVNDGAIVVDAPVKSGSILKTLHQNDEIRLNGIEENGYYELQDGGYIAKNSVKILTKIKSATVSHRGEVRMKDSLIEKTFLHYTKDALTADNLDSGLNAVKNLGSIDAAIFLKPDGKDYSAALGIVESKPFAGYVSIDNSGDHSTGIFKTSLGLALNDRFGYGEKISTSIVTTGQNLLSGSLSGSMPIGCDSSTISTGVSRMKYSLGDSFKSLDATGTSTGYWVGYNKPLWLSYKGQATYGAKLTRSRMVDEMNAFSTTTYRASTTLENTLSFVKQDSWHGGGSNGAFVDFKLGHLEAGSSADTYNKVGGYAKLNVELQRSQQLGSFTGLLSLKAQKAFRNLDSSEKFNLTGLDAVGGYYSGDIVGDQGILASVEVSHDIPAVNNLSGALVYTTGAAQTLFAPIDSSSNIQKASSIGAKLTYAAKYDIAANLGLYKRVTGETVGNYDQPYHFLFNLSKKF